MWHIEQISFCERCQELLATYQETSRELQGISKRIVTAVSNGERDAIGELAAASRQAHEECRQLRQLMRMHLQMHAPPERA